jgi:hypothetical protein
MAIFAIIGLAPLWIWQFSRRNACMGARICRYKEAKSYDANHGLDLPVPRACPMMGHGLQRGTKPS